jgi:hypothetical protein
MIPGFSLLPRARLARAGIVLLAATLLGLPGTAFSCTPTYPDQGWKRKFLAINQFSAERT